jgi:hypothetical protein
VIAAVSGVLQRHVGMQKGGLPQICGAGEVDTGQSEARPCG